MSSLFLLDSDIFISSFRSHHPMTYAEFHNLWFWLERLAAKGEVKIINHVFKELTERASKNDLLAEWTRKVFHDDRIINTKTDEIISKYQDVQSYLAECGFYSENSYKQWEPEDKADPWLIAAAIVNNAIIVTNEQPVNLSHNQLMKKEPKIPNVAEKLGVTTMNLRTFYDESLSLTPTNSVP